MATRMWLAAVAAVPLAIGGSAAPLSAEDALAKALLANPAEVQVGQPLSDPEQFGDKVFTHFIPTNEFVPFISAVGYEPLLVPMAIGYQTVELQAQTAGTRLGDHGRLHALRRHAADVLSG